jgi:hypothetical protein
LCSLIAKDDRTFEDDVIYATKRILPYEARDIEIVITTRQAIRQLEPLSAFYAKGLLLNDKSEKLYPPQHMLNRNLAIWKGGIETLEVDAIVNAGIALYFNFKLTRGLWAVEG